MFTATHRQTRSTDANLGIASSKNRHSPETGVSVTLESLLPDLRRIAAQRAAMSNGELSDGDLLQHMVEDVLVYQRSHHRMGNRSYHRQRAWNRAADCLRSLRTYRRYVSVMPVCIDEEGVAVDLTELMPAPGATPEEQVIAAENLTQLRSQLTETQYHIITLLLDGVSQADIAADLSTSRSNVSQHLTGIRQRLSPLFAHSAA